MTKEEIEQLKLAFQQIESKPIIKPEVGDYHKEENGLVTFYRANGHAFMIIPAEDFEAIKVWSKDNA